MLKGVVSNLLNGKYELESFTPAMRIFLNTATGKAFWKWFADHGALGPFTFSDREQRADGQVRRYRGELGRKFVLVLCQADERRQDRADLLVVDAILPCL